MEALAIRSALTFLVVLLLVWMHAGGAPTDVGPQMRRQVEAEWIAQDAGRGATTVGAVRRSAHDVTTAEDAAGGVDGIKTGICGFHTLTDETDPWWQVDLGKPSRLDRIVVFNRTDNNLARRTRNLRILVARDPKGNDLRPIYQHDGTPFLGVKQNRPLVVHLREKGVVARVVRLMVPGRCSFALDEIEVYAAKNPARNIALGKPADQKSVGRYSYPGTKGYPPPKLKAEPVQPTGPAFSLAHTREVVARASRLAARLHPEASPRRLEPLATKLDTLRKRLARLDEAPEDVRRKLYLDARWLARKIAFCNPLLDIDRLLFTKRHHPGSLFHMVHRMALT